MGKKVQKALQGQQQASSTSQEGGDEDEPYNCTGNVYNDFPELCRRANMAVTPIVMQRPKRPPSPSQPSGPEPGAAKGKKGKDAKAAEPPPEPEVEKDENGEPVEPPPKTYTTRDKFEYFKPCLQVEQDHPDKGDTVTETYIRGWKVDESMLGTLLKCWTSMTKLHSIHLWHVGMDAPSLSQLAAGLAQMETVKHLTLDNNAIPEENFHVLIMENSHIEQLSLRYNSITDKGATLLSDQLGSMKKRNETLVSLNLTGNAIGDKGAIALAAGLRTNRCLLSLTLTGNKIGDEGAIALGEVLSRFPLTHEEIVERRKAMSERTSPDRARSPPPSRRADSKERPNSVRSAGDKTKGRDKGKPKKDGKDDKNDKTLKGTKKDDKKDDKKKAASNTADAGKTAGKTKSTKGKEKGKDKGKEEAERAEQPAESGDQQNPLLDPNAEFLDGKLYITGNRQLINLNLSRNQIDEKGLESLLKAIQYQTTLCAFNKAGGPGLMRLALSKNQFNTDSDAYSQLSSRMLTKDPFYKPESPDHASQQS